MFKAPVLALLAVALAFFSSAPEAQGQTVQAAPPNGVEDFGMTGGVGRFPVALVVKVRDYVQIISAHYAYVSRKVSIPLKGRIEGGQVIMEEPDGGLFRLHFVTSDASAKKPLTFWTSTGLEGTWTKGEAAQPVRLRFEQTGQDLRECALYPPARQTRGGPQFPNQGCDMTPDQSVIDACLARPFTDNKAIAACIGEAVRTCRDDQLDMNFCMGNVRAYLDQTAKIKLHRGGEAGAVKAAGYRRWTRSRLVTCKRDSEVSPSGSGYNASIDLCMSEQITKLLQNALLAATPPFKND